MLFFCLEVGFALWGCYNKISHTGWLINYKHLFFTVLVAGRPKSECQYGWERALLWVADCQLLPVSSQEEARRALIPFIRVPPSLPKHLPKAPHFNAITLGIRILTDNGAGGGGGGGQEHLNYERSIPRILHLLVHLNKCTKCISSPNINYFMLLYETRCL